MQNDLIIEPDLAFIEDISNNGGARLKQCFQCATCSVVCKLAPDYRPFPRKEMIYAAWGLKDRLLGDPDIWLCHNCGDCSSLCPRGARPGDTLAAIRRLAIEAYTGPRWMHKMINHPKFAPLLLIIPALIILGVGFASGLLNLHHEGGPVVYTEFFPVGLIEMIFIPLSILVGLMFVWGIRRFLAAMQTSYIQRGIAKPKAIEPVPYLKTLLGTLPSIVKHDRFALCTQQRGRKNSHMLVAFAFVGLALVAGAFVFALYVFHRHGPYDQLNPVKLFANLAGLALIVGSALLIRERLRDSNGDTTYFDGYLLLLALLLGMTGMLTQWVRLAQWPRAALISYLIHLVLVFNLIAFLPFSKMAHFVYRIVAMAYNRYAQKHSGA